MRSTKRDANKSLKVWEKLVIIVGDEDTNEAGYYEGRVEDFLNGGIVVNNPVFVAGNSMLRQDLPVTVQVCRDDAIYQFASRIRSYTRGTGRRLVLTPPQSMRRIQRRQFVRIQMSSTVAFSIVPEALDWNDWENSLTWTESHLVDISAGGVQILGDDTIHEGDILLLNIDFFSEEEIPLPVVCLCRRAYDKDDTRFCGLQFLIVDRPCEQFKSLELSKWPPEIKRFTTKQQDKLSNYLFRKQVEFRQKGVI